MSRDDRKHERLPTALVVRFASAEHFVTEYAENLSVGGLFLRHGHHLEPLSLVRVQIDLPGFSSFEVTAKVAHLLDEETATRYQREPGAGLQLVEVPDRFEDALMGYLARLGKRHDCSVLVQEPECATMLASSGYQVQRIELSTVTEHLQNSTAVLALVVSKAAASKFRELTADSPRSVPVIGCHCPQDEDPLLVELDRLLESL